MSLASGVAIGGLVIAFVWLDFRAQDELAVRGDDRPAYFPGVYLCRLISHNWATR